MNAIQTLIFQLNSSHELLATIMSDVTEDILHKDPGGEVGTIAANYGHIIAGEDALIQGMLKKSMPISMEEFKGKTGFDKVYPSMDKDYHRNTSEWMKSVKVDLTKLAAYAKTTQARAEEYLSTLTDADLDRELDLSEMGLGKKPLLFVIHGFLLGHINTHIGEISAVKGVLGKKGYPF